MRYEFGRRKYRFAPYLFGGVGFFHFNPRAKYNNEWVNLRNIGTEGQGLPQYPNRKKYFPVQVAIPLGIGIKYNYTRQISFSFEYGYRLTFTDYIDDVSKTYPDAKFFEEFYADKPETAEKAIALSPALTRIRS